MDFSNYDDQEVSSEVFKLVQFYGSVVATPNMTPENYEICNSYIKKLVESLSSISDKVIMEQRARSSNLKII